MLKSFWDTKEWNDLEPWNVPVIPHIYPPVQQKVSLALSLKRYK